jgi:hypothetical protein
MISIRPFEEGDNPTLLDIEKLCPQGNENRLKNKGAGING